VQVAGKLAADPELKVRAALDHAAERLGGRFEGQPAVEGAIRHVIGVTYKEMGLFSEAEQQLTQAMRLLIRARGANHEEVLTTAGELGAVYVNMGRPTQAEPLLARAAEGFRATRGDGDRATLSALNGLTLLVTGEKREALYDRILRAQQRVLGDEHPDTLGVMNNLAATYLDSGKYAGAERLYLHLVAVKTRVLGKDHPSTLLSTNYLGVAYRFQGRYAEAESVLTSLRDTRRRVLGPEHPDTLGTINSLALVYGAQGRDAEAEALLQQTLATRRRLLGDTHPNTIATLNNLAELYFKCGHLAEAEALFQRILEVRQRDLDPNHHNLVNVLSALGELKLDQQKFDDAERYLRDALRRREDGESDTWRRYYMQSLLGASVAALGRFEEAEPLLLAGHEGLVRQRRTIPAESQRLLGRAKGWLAGMYQDWGKPDKALAFLDPGMKPLRETGDRTDAR
jgi:tetratricopeptide (TPR) repeat protein